MSKELEKVEEVCCEGWDASDKEACNEVDSCNCEPDKQSCC